jgi:hypothetical protein
VVAGAVTRDRERAALYALDDVDDEVTGALATARGGALSGRRPATLYVERSALRAAALTRAAGTGAGGASAGVATGGGAESPCTTVPADCIDTGSVATTGVDTAGSVSTVARAIAVSWVESVRATVVESKGRPAAVSGCANAIFRPNDSALGWLVGSVSATKARGAGFGGEGVLFFASQAPIASDANTRTPKPFQT